MGILTYFKNLLSTRPRPKSLHGLTGVDFADALFHNLVAEQSVPGISVTILQNGQMLLKKGYGYSDLQQRTPMDPEKSILRIASISKCITGLAFGKMVEDGLLDWDDSLYKHVPYYPKKQYDFSLRQLASHTAGIRGYRGKEFALNQAYSIKEGIEVFKNDPLIFQPGRGYLYNSYDFVLLSLAMQEASGIPFASYVREKILKPLKMNMTLTPEELPSDLTRSIKTSEFYTKRVSGFRKAVEVNNSYKLSGGGYLSSSSDIAKMGQAVLERQLLNKETYEELFTAQIINEKSSFYGLGFQVSQDDSMRPFIGHVGNSVGAYTNLFIYPEDKTVIAILTNCTDPKVQLVYDRAIAQVFGAGTST